MSKLVRTGSCGSSSPSSPRLPSWPSRTPAVAVNAVAAGAVRHIFIPGGAALHSHSSLASASLDLDDLALVPTQPSAMSSGSGTEMALGGNTGGSQLSATALLQRAAEFMQLALKVMALLVTLLAEAWTSRCPREGMRRLARPARAHQHFIAAR